MQISATPECLLKLAEAFQSAPHPGIPEILTALAHTVLGDSIGPGSVSSAVNTALPANASAPFGAMPAMADLMVA